jgi:hypothetical protein
MPLVAGEHVRTPLGAFRVVFGIGHFWVVLYVMLLRMRGARPSRRRAAERGQEFSSSDVTCHVTLRLGVIHAMEG